MIFGVVEANWTFVQSHTYTTISIVVGIIVSVFIAALLIQRELLQEPGAADYLARSSRDKELTPPPMLFVDDLPRHPYGKSALIPLLLCFGVIVILRLATLAYRRPDTTSTDPAMSTVKATPIPTRPNRPLPQLTVPAVGALPHVSKTDDVPSPIGRAFGTVLYPTTGAVGMYAAFFWGASPPTTRLLSVPPTSRQASPNRVLQQISS